MTTPTPREALAEWRKEAERLAMDFAHCYAFVGDDTMPKAKAALFAHLAKPPTEAARASLAAVQPPLAAQSEQPQGNLAVSSSGDVHGDTSREAPTVDPERDRCYRENAEFHEWWEAEQACPEHTLIVQNAAHAAWQERGKRAYAESLGYRRPGAAEGAKESCNG